MKLVPYRDITDSQMKTAILPETQEEGELIHRAIKELAISGAEGLTPEDIEDLAKMLEVLDNAVDSQ